ncbi:MAG: c-type cytochrome domain-containing protein, partial [Bryobacteraceae bacterium]
MRYGPIFLLAVVPVYAQQDFFESRVRPILATNCFSCHTASKLGGLEMKSQDTLLIGGKSGPAVIP